MTRIVTYPLDGIQYDAKDAAAYFAPRTSGVYSAEDCFTVAPAGGYTLTVSSGIAWVHPARFVGYSIVKEEPDTLTLSVADASRPRIDRVVLRYDAAASASRLLVLEGTPASTPTAPELSRTALVYDLCLCEVLRPAGSTGITASHLTDTRLDEDLCGVMRDAVEGIPTASLLAAAKERIAALEETASQSAQAAAASQKAAAKSEQNAAASATAAGQSEAAAKQALTDTQAAETAALEAIGTARAGALEDVAASTQTAINAAAEAGAAKTAAAGSASVAASAAGAASTSESNAAASADNASADAERAEAAAKKAEAVVGTDKTLTVEGAPADAAAVGEALGKKAEKEHSHGWDEIENKPEAFPPSAHTHDYAPSSHTHDGRYYTKSETDTKLNGKANSSHSHNYAGSGSAGGTANSVNGFTFGAQTSDPGANSSLTTNKVLFVYE